MLSVMILSVIMLSVTMLNVVAPRTFFILRCYDHTNDKAPLAKNDLKKFVKKFREYTHPVWVGLNKKLFKKDRFLNNNC